MTKDRLVIESLQLKVTGLAFSFGPDLACYFLSLSNDIKSQSEANDSLAPESHDPSISLEDKLDLIKIALSAPASVGIYDLKTFLKLTSLLGWNFVNDLTLQDKFFDPKVAAWMLKPGENEMTLATLVMNFKPELAGILDTLGSAR